MNHLSLSLLTVWVAFLFPQTLSAQCSVSGKVTDAEEQPLPYISVQLLRTDSAFVAGMTTDTLGQYQFAKLKASDYLLAFSSIGYRKRIVRIRAAEGKTEVPTVRMEADNIALNEVVVKGASVIRQKDHLLILPDKQQAKQAGTGYDLLYNLMIPGLEVDRINGKVNAFKGEATLYINGRQADFREVQSLRPRDVQKVEYFDLPTGKYVGDKASINFVTRQYKAGGYVAVDGKQTIGYTNGDYNLVGKLSKGNTSYTLFAGYSMNNYDSDSNDNHEHFAFPDYDVDRYTRTLTGKVKNNTPYAQLSIAHQNEKHQLVGKIAFTRNNAPDNYSREAVEYKGGEYDARQESYRTTDQSGNMPSIALYGHFNLKKDQYIEVSLDGNYSDNHYSYSYQEEGYSTSTRTDEDNYKFTIDMRYGIKWNEHNNLSVRAAHYHRISSASYQSENPTWQHLWTGETVLYLEYSRMLGKNLTFKAAPGISSQQYRLHGEALTNKTIPRMRLDLNYRLSDRHQLSFNGYFGSSIPVIPVYNNSVQEIDPLTIKKGNSQLDNNIFGDFNLYYSGQFNKFSLYAALNYAMVGHVIADDNYIENDKLVKTYRSDVKAHSHHGMASASWKATEHFRLKVDGYWAATKIFNHKDIEGSQYNIYGLLQLDYYWKDFSCSLYGKTKTKDFSSDLVYKYEPAKYGLSARWSRGNWLVEAATESPFTKHRRWKQVLSQQAAYQYTNHMTGRIYQHTGFIKVAYTVDFGKKTARDYNDVNRNVDSGILKAY